MTGATITIDRIRIRVSTGDMSPAQGQQLGERIQALLAERLAAQAGLETREIGAVTLTLAAGENASVDELARRVADAIVRQM